MSDLPINEGITDPVDIEINSEPTKPSQIKMSASTTFEDIVKEYTLFTHAAVLLFGGMTFDPVSQFIRDIGIPGGLKILMLDTPIFEGLEVDGNSYFNNILFAVPNDTWPNLSRYLGTIGIHNSSSKEYVNVEIQRIPMPDLISMARSSVVDKVPFVDIYVTALDGNKACLHFQPAQQPGGRLRFVRSKPRKATIKLARDIFAKRPNLSAWAKESK